MLYGGECAIVEGQGPNTLCLVPVDVMAMCNYNLACVSIDNTRMGKPMTPSSGMGEQRPTCLPYASQKSSHTHMEKPERLVWASCSIVGMLYAPPTTAGEAAWRKMRCWATRGRGGGGSLGGGSVPTLDTVYLADSRSAHSLSLKHSKTIPTQTEALPGPLTSIYQSANWQVRQARVRASPNLTAAVKIMKAE